MFDQEQLAAVAAAMSILQQQQQQQALIDQYQIELQQNQQHTAPEQQQQQPHQQPGNQLNHHHHIDASLSPVIRTQPPMSTYSSIVKNSLTNHLNTNASNSLINNHQDIFSNNNSYQQHTNNLTGNSLGQTNGSSLLNQHNTNITSTISNDIHQQQNLALEPPPTLNYTTDHSTLSPAHQLYSATNDHHPNNHHHLHQQQQQLQLQQKQNSLLGRHYNVSTELSDNQYHYQHHHQLQLQQQQQQHLQQQQQQQQQQQPQPLPQPQHQSILLNNANSLSGFRLPISGKNTPPQGRATNLLGFMGLYVGNLSPDLTKEQLEKLFSKYGEPVKAHRLIRSPVAFIKYENTESPRAAIDDLYGLLLPDLTLNQDQPLKLHFDRNDAQLKANYRPTDLPKDDNGECYGWRTTVCRRGKSCPKKHIPINRGIDFQMWMIKSSPTPATALTTSANTFNTIN